MWRPRPLALVTLSLALGLLGLVLVGSAPASTPSVTPGCGAHYHAFGEAPLACGFPGSYTITYPCGLQLSTSFVQWCTVSLPDLNPADWLSWLYCGITSDIGAIWTGIESDVAHFVTTFFVNTFQALLNTLGSAIGSLESVIIGFFVTLTQDIDSLINEVAAIVGSAGASAGPFGPVVVALLAGGLVVVGAIGIYFALKGLIAVGKTVFNLL